MDCCPGGTSEALAADLYLVIRVVPERIDLLYESRGYGARETLEIEDIPPELVVGLYDAMLGWVNQLKES